MIVLGIVLAVLVVYLQTLVEIGVDKNSTVVRPAPLMSTIGEPGTFLNREFAPAGRPVPGAVGNTNGSPITTGA